MVAQNLYREVVPTAVTVSAAVKAASGLYFGFALRETTGTTPATIRIYDNAAAAAGTLLDVIQLAAGESVREFWPGGLRALNGIYFSVVSGTVEGSVRADR